MSGEFRGCDSPRPWRLVTATYGESESEILDAEGDYVASGDWEPNSHTITDGELIVFAVNSFYPLIGACAIALRALERLTGGTMQGVEDEVEQIRAVMPRPGSTAT